MRSTATPRIAVIGAGIGGLTTAIALRAKGFEVEVYEQASELSEIGAGLSLGANGTRILQRLGLGPALAVAAAEPQRIEFHHWQTGDIFYEHPMGDWYTGQFGAPFLTYHRADLQRALLGAYEGPAPKVGHRLTGLIETPDEVQLTFANGVTATADLVVGADGLRSTVRQHVLAGDDTDAVFSSMSCFRGMVPIDLVPGGDKLGLSFFLGGGRHMVAYPVRNNELINFIAYVQDPVWTLESWSAKGDINDALAAFDGWNDTVLSILRNTELTGRWALYDREALRTWSTARVTLLGDAAHPMLPHHGQGSNQAVEDVAVLAHYLTVPDLPPAEALQRYESVRKARTRQIQMGSRGNAACFQLPDGAAADARNAGLANLPTMVSWIHGHDAEADL